LIKVVLRESGTKGCFSKHLEVLIFFYLNIEFAFDEVVKGELGMQLSVV